MYKRLITVFIAVLMIALVTVPVFADAKTGIVSVTTASMRKTAKTSGKVLLKLKKNTRVTITGTSGSWYKVKYSGKAGYVLKKSIKPEVDASKLVINVNKTLKKGSAGDGVRALQYALKSLRFYFGSIHGSYDTATYNAVKLFQATAEIKVDGVAGSVTLKLIKDGFIPADSVKDDDVPMVDIDPAKLPPTSGAAYQYKAEKADWWTVGEKVIPRGGTMTVVDVKTGLVWNAKRIGGTNHADSEPLTLKDTNNVKKIVGGKTGYSWNRRAILVTYVDPKTKKGRTFAASMNFMPHGSAPSNSNGFPGHFCIHMLNSRTHGSNKVDSDHQRCVKEAYASKYAAGKDGQGNDSNDSQGQQKL